MTVDQGRPCFLRKHGHQCPYYHKEDFDWNDVFCVEVHGVGPADMEELLHRFQQFGVVETFRRVDANSVFMQFAHHRHARYAVIEMNGVEWGGRPLVVSSVAGGGERVKVCPDDLVKVVLICTITISLLHCPLGGPTRRKYDHAVSVDFTFPVK